MRRIQGDELYYSHLHLGIIISSLATQRSWGLISHSFPSSSSAFNGLRFCQTQICRGGVFVTCVRLIHVVCNTMHIKQLISPVSSEKIQFPQLLVSFSSHTFPEKRALYLKSFFFFCLSPRLRSEKEIAFTFSLLVS